jgi:lipid II:glycine glycyltransferase (peptidoglycan interpeptide bridge formation enzyme)
VIQFQYTLSQAHDREQWDVFVSASGHLLQSWEWGELKASVGWYPLRLALWDERGERIVAAAQALRRAPAHMPPRLGNLAYIPKGPMIDRSYVTASEQEAGLLQRIFFTQLLATLRSEGALAVQVELPQVMESGGGLQTQTALEDDEARQTIRTLKAMGFYPVRPVQPARSILLDLTPDEDVLLAGTKEKWRYNVRLAARRGVVVRVAKSIQDIRDWYRILRVTGQRDGFGIHTLDYYVRAWQLFAPRNLGQLFLAEHDGRLLAGIFVGCMARQAIYLYGASSNEQRQLMPNYLLQWEAMRWAKSQGARRYDFWGIPDSDDPGEALAGVYRFKSGWGGQIARFAGNYEYACRPVLMRLARRFVRM